jgi:hypothetical protein
MAEKEETLRKKYILTIKVLTIRNPDSSVGTATR